MGVLVFLFVIITVAKEFREESVNRHSVQRESHEAFTSTKPDAVEKSDSQTSVKKRKHGSSSALKSKSATSVGSKGIAKSAAAVSDSGATSPASSNKKKKHRSEDVADQEAKSGATKSPVAVSGKSKSKKSKIKEEKSPKLTKSKIKEEKPPKEKKSKTKSPAKASKIFNAEHYGNTNIFN